MREPNVPEDTGRAPASTQDASQGPELMLEGTAARLLERLERTLDAELGPLRAGAEPLLDEVRQGLAALCPAEGGMLLPPKEQQTRRARLGETLNELEDVLEALQLAARSGANAAPGAR